MKKILENHMKYITPEALQDFKDSCISIFATYSTPIGICQLGVNSEGKYIVKLNSEIKAFENPEDAIDEYENTISSK